MTSGLAWLLVWWALGGVAPAAAGDGPAAVLLGEAVRLDEPDSRPDPMTRVLQLFKRLWLPLSRHYIADHGLSATDAEIAEVADYHREFERRDRAQRARKLRELNDRLATGGLPAKDRAWLEEFRAVLVRMERRDAEAERKPPPDPRGERERFAAWVEMSKLNRELYEQYGGVVAQTILGPDPKGARAALFADYERWGLLAFEDEGLRLRLFEWLEAPPSIIVRAGDVDFTPYWRRPIPPSYFPD